MKLVDLLTPKNDDGSLDQRYRSIANQICDLAGEKCRDVLYDFHEKTNQLESNASCAALHFVKKAFLVEMDDYQRKRINKTLSDALKELGFKPSKVSRLINAGRFLSTYDWLAEIRCYFGCKSQLSGRELNDKLDEYFAGYGVGAIDLLSRTTLQGRKKAYQHFNKSGTHMTQSALEDIQRAYPTNPGERKGRKPSRANFQETRPTPALTTHESLEVMDDAKEESAIAQPEWGQKLVKQFFLFLASGEMDQCLAGFAPAAQAHLIGDVEAVQSLLEEFIAKHQPIEVIPIH